MRKEREALLVATLAGLVIVGAAAFVVQPSLAGKGAPGGGLAGTSQISLMAATKAG